MNDRISWASLSSIRILCRRMKKRKKKEEEEGGGGRRRRGRRRRRKKEVEKNVDSLPTVFLELYPQLIAYPCLFF